MVGFCVLDKNFFRDWLPTCCNTEFAPTTGVECLQNSNHYGFKPYFLWGKKLLGEAAVENFRWKKSKGKFSLNATDWCLRIKSYPYICFCDFWVSKNNDPLSLGNVSPPSNSCWFPKWMFTVGFVVFLCCWIHVEIIGPINQSSYISHHILILGELSCQLLLGRWFSNAHFVHQKQKPLPKKIGKKHPKKVPGKVIFWRTEVSSTWRCDSR